MAVNMIRITEIESQTKNSDLKGRVFKVEGALHLRDAQLLERICRHVAAQTRRPVLIDLNDVCFVDDAGAAVLCRMKRDCVASIEGLTLFTRKVVELADASQTE